MRCLTIYHEELAESTDTHIWRDIADVDKATLQRGAIFSARRHI